MIKRGDIFMAGIDGVCGKHPVLVVQNDTGNQYSTSVIAAIITSKPKKDMPTHVGIYPSCGVLKRSTVLCEHIVTLDKDQLVRKVGTLRNTYKMHEVDAAIAVSLGL